MMIKTLIMWMSVKYNILVHYAPPLQISSKSYFFFNVGGLVCAFPQCGHLKGIYIYFCVLGPKYSTGMTESSFYTDSDSESSKFFQLYR